MDMMVNARGEEKYGGHHNLGLSLSLGIATAAPVEPSPPPPRQQRALSVAPVSSFPAPPQQHPQCWNGFGAGFFFTPSSGMDRSLERKQQQQSAAAAACHSHEMPFLRGIDVNRAPVAESRRGSCSEDEEPGASSPNSTLSSLSGKRGAPARSGGGGGDQDGDLTPRAGGGGSDDEDSGAGGGSRKKLRLSKDQAAVLEESFKEHNTLNPKQKAALARQLNLKPRQVEVWFQNRRARTKLKQTEVDCEFLKRCCESLTEENRRLQREVAELRALKLVAPHHYARMPPPTTLTMCPSCERVASAAGDEAARAAPRPAAPAGPWGPVVGRPVFVDGPARRS